MYSLARVFLYLNKHLLSCLASVFIVDWWRLLAEISLIDVLLLLWSLYLPTFLGFFYGTLEYLHYFREEWEDKRCSCKEILSVITDMVCCCCCWSCRSDIFRIGHDRHLLSAHFETIFWSEKSCYVLKTRISLYIVLYELTVFHWCYSLVISKLSVF